MIFKGYKIRVRCIDWEQESYLGAYWNFVSKHIGYTNLIGLGMNWSEDYLYFDYLLGVIDDEDTLEKLKQIDFKRTKYKVKYLEVELPELKEWKSFKGKEANLRMIYEKDIDCNNMYYDYELEYIDGKGNIEIKIHYIKQ